MSEKNNIALVLGGHINGYSIIKELSEQGINNIALFDPGKSIARFSNKIIYRSVIDKTPEKLLAEIKKLHQQYDYIVVYPTDDLQVENLHHVYDEIKEFCYLPFNNETILKSLNKFYQYSVCKEIGIPYPKTVHARKTVDLDGLESLTFPLLIKPSTRLDATTDVFRTLYLEDAQIFVKEKNKLIAFLENGIEFIISEFIPGDDTNIYAYTCFRSNEGQILNEWRGKKLTQYPGNYGVFSSASNEAPEIVQAQGRLLVETLNAYGVVEPEFKYDHRDGKFKLMEINLRSMMWHRTGNISGVKLHETQYLYATKETPVKYAQKMDERIHFVLMLHEIPNLIARPGYWRHFKSNIFKGDNRVWAVYEKDDLKPFLYSLVLLGKTGVAACLRRLGLR